MIFLDKVILYDINEKVEASYVPFGEGEKVQLVKHNNSGSMIASVSQRGHFIAVHDYRSLNRLRLFFRGHTAGKIVSIVFSEHNNYMSSLSDRGTIHVFSFGGEVSKKMIPAQRLLSDKMGSYFEYFQSENSLSIARTDFSKEEQLAESKL